MSSVEPFIEYVESRVGLNGCEDHLYWKKYPPVPDWIPRPEIWEEAKRRMLRSEIHKLQDIIEAELPSTESLLKRLQLVQQAYKSIEESHEEKSCETRSPHFPQIVQLSSQNNVMDSMPQFSPVERPDDDFENLREVVHNIWNKATGWTSLLEKDTNNLTSVANMQSQNVDNIETTLRKTKDSTRGATNSFFIILGQLAFAIFYTFIAVMMILLGIKS